MKKKVLAFSTLVIVALVLGMGYLKMGTKIHNRITEYKEKCKRTAEYDMMHKDVERIAALPDVSIQGDEWFCNRPVISHSGGVFWDIVTRTLRKRGNIHTLAVTECLMQTACLRPTV